MSILIDGHVHIHPAFTIERFFDAAFGNFQKVAACSGGDAKYQYVLALTESGDRDFFTTLYDKALPFNESASPASGLHDLIFQKTGESNSLLVRKGAQVIILLAGRQLVSTENIEVLSLCSSVRHQDRAFPLAGLVRKVSQCGAVPVIPWGVGKWFGSRGEVVAELISSHLEFPLFVGDNGNRPLLWPTPALLKNANTSGLPLLSGSDPLPLASHAVRPASFGTRIDGVSIALDSPASALSELLLRQNGSIRYSPFGRKTSSISFVMDQLRINLGNRLSSSLPCY